MSQPVFSFTFNEILGSSSAVLFIDQHRNRRHLLHIGVDDLALIRSNKQCLPEIVADMIDVAASIHFADRLIDKSSDTICEINVTLPLRDLYSFSDANIRESLEDVLYWYTGDHWRFHFVKRVSEKRAAETQIHFPFNESNRTPIEMALWSGGLDSMAGLYNRLKAYPDTHFILVGTGSNVYTHAIQRDVAHEIGRVFSERTTLGFVK